MGLGKLAIAPLLAVSAGSCRKLAKNERGSAAVEFAIIAPLVIGLVLSTFEAGVLYLRTGMVEVSSDSVNRDIYSGLSSRSGISRADMVDAFCTRLRTLMPCGPGNVTLEVRRISGTTAITDAPTCTNSGPGVGGSRLPAFHTPSSGDLVFVRFCAVADVLVPGLGDLTFRGINVGLSLPQIPGGGYGIVMGSVFRMEPF